MPSGTSNTTPTRNVMTATISAMAMVMSGSELYRFWVAIASPAPGNDYRAPGSEPFYRTGISCVKGAQDGGTCIILVGMPLTDTNQQAPSPLRVYRGRGLG